MGRSQTLGAVALSSLTVASAFQNTSPLFVFSTAKHLDGFEAPIPQIATSSHTALQLNSLVGGCTAKSYVVVSQPAVQASDYKSASSAPWLRRWAAGEDKAIASSAIIPEVVGGTNADDVASYIQKTCNADVIEVHAADGYISLEDQFPRVVRIKFNKLSRYDEERAAGLAEHDSFLNAVVSSLHSPNYTIIYTTTPPLPSDLPAFSEHGQSYEMDDAFPSALHTELKRDVSAHAGNSSQASLGLFESYMFFSPGIFMALTVTIPLVMILYVAVSAVAGLEVSYFAFSKEMGPGQGKKQG